MKEIIKAQKKINDSISKTLGIPTVDEMLGKKESKCRCDGGMEFDHCCYDQDDE